MCNSGILQIAIKEELAGLLQEIAQRVGMSCTDVITQIIFEYHPKMFKENVLDEMNVVLATDSAVNMWLEDLGIANEDMQLIVDAIVELLEE